MIAIGVDPGGSYTGVIVRTDGEGLLFARVLKRDELVDAHVNADPVTRRHAWLHVVLEAIAEQRAGLRDLDKRGRVIVAAENVVKPHPRGGQVDGRARVIDPGPILDTAVVLGAILGRWPDTVLVAPRHNGAGYIGAYPAGLRGARPNLGGPPKHARSAWDVAGRALQFARFTNPTPGGSE